MFENSCLRIIHFKQEEEAIRELTFIKCLVKTGLMPFRVVRSMLFNSHFTTNGGKESLMEIYTHARTHTRTPIFMCVYMMYIFVLRNKLLLKIIY